jgi:serine/threonine protein phosphatase PrpC
MHEQFFGKSSFEFVARSITWLNQGTCAISRGGKAVRLTYDHKGSDAHEAKRITDAGGFVMNNRVNGGSSFSNNNKDIDRDYSYS